MRCICKSWPGTTNTRVHEPLCEVHGVDAVHIARLFHEQYELLAPQFGYRTRPESAIEWDQLPEKHRALMAATVQAVRSQLMAKVTGA